MQLQLGNIVVDVVRKDIKNLHLSVHPPTGRVTIAAPARMSPDAIRVFAISKLAWIKRHQSKLREQGREPPREYLDRESHYVWGRRYMLQVVEQDQSPSIALKHSRMRLTVRPRTDEAQRAQIVARWYRDQLRAALPELLTKWEPALGVRAHRVFVQKMKTKWGSCNAATRTIRLNTELTKKPRQCLEYILVHELAHLRVRNHAEKFTALMDAVLPAWREIRGMLNSEPLAYEKWSY